MIVLDILFFISLFMTLYMIPPLIIKAFRGHEISSYHFFLCALSMTSLIFLILYTW